MSERPVTDLIWPGCVLSVKRRGSSDDRLFRVTDVIGPYWFPELLLEHPEWIWDWESMNDERQFCSRYGVTRGELGTMYPHWTVTCSWPNAPDYRRRKGPYIFNELVVSEGRLRFLFNANLDELIVVERSGQRLLF